MKKCPFCAEEIQDDAVKCKYCKEWLKRESEEEWVTIAPMIGEARKCEKTIEKKSHQKVIVGNVKNPGVAFILSFFMPGLGQFYNGHIWQGFLVLILFWTLVWTIVGGVIVWGIGMVDAYYSAKRINEEVINS